MRWFRVLMRGFAPGPGVRWVGLGLGLLVGPVDPSNRVLEPLAGPPRLDLDALPVRGLSTQELAPVRPRATPGAAAPAHDIGVMLGELRRLEGEPGRFLRIARPVQAAMLLAATRTVAELEARQHEPGRPALIALAEA